MVSDQIHESDSEQPSDSDCDSIDNDEPNSSNRGARRRVFSKEINPIMKISIKDQEYETVESLEKEICSIMKQINAKRIEQFERNPVSINRVTGGVENLYKIDVWISKIPRDFSNKFKIEFSRITNHLAAFYYRNNPSEIFVLTSGYATKYLQSYCDPYFTNKIARRLVDFNTIVSDKRLHLHGFGNIRSNTQIMREPESIFSDITAMVTSFVASAKQRSSLFRLPSFETLRSLKLTVTRNYIQLGRKTSPSDDMEILQHFSDICNGEKTYDTAGNEESDSSDNQCIKLVNSSFCEKLDLQLAEKIYDSILNRKLGFHHCFPFSLVHPNQRKILVASTYKLYSKADARNPIKKWGSVPESTAVLLVLAGKYPNLNPSIPADKKKEFLKSIQFSVMDLNDEVVARGNILEFIECLLNETEDFTHWKMGSTWYSINYDKLADVHKKFIDAIKNEDFFIPTTHPDHLALKWQFNEKEDEYNQKYMMEKEFILGDVVSIQKGIEYFDLLKCDKNSGRTILYHVKRNVGQKTRDACSQVRNSADIITKFTRFRRGYEYDVLTEMFEKLQNPKDEKYKQNAKLKSLGIQSFDDFRKLFEKKLTFIYAFTRETNTSLEKEKCMPIRINLEDLSKMVTSLIENNHHVLLGHLARGLNLNSLAKIDEVTLSLYKFLISKGFIDDEGHVSSRLIYANKIFFSEFEKLEKDSPEFFDKLLEDFKTSFHSLIAKIEVVKTKNILAELGCDFLIDEIEVESSSSQNLASTSTPVKPDRQGHSSQIPCQRVRNSPGTPRKRTKQNQSQNATPEKQMQLDKYFTVLPKKD